MRKNKGITLIALVITIITLIILAGVSMRIITKRNGIVGMAQRSSSNYNIQAEKERLEMVVAELQMESNLYGTIPFESIKNKLIERGLAEESKIDSTTRKVETTSGYGALFMKDSDGDWEVEVADIETIAAIEVSAAPEATTNAGPIANADGNITGMTGGDMQVSAVVNLTGDIDYSNTKYVFKTSNSALGTSDESLYNDGTISQASSTITIAKPSGTYYLHVLVVGTNGGKKEIISTSTAISTGNVKNFEYTGDVQSISLTPGRYKLEVWGAEGGFCNDNSVSGGKGGYSVGELSFSTSTKIYVYVGQKGMGNRAASPVNGWNGGGDSAYGVQYNAGGGGATDMSLQGADNSSEWNESNHLFSRLIVAGGGRRWNLV